MPHPKQERRGGIETGLILSRDLGRRESRNAVVALKPLADNERGDCHTRKQERRGGIETILGDIAKPLGTLSRNAVVALKRGLTIGRSGEESQAGTPWWH